VPHVDARTLATSFAVADNILAPALLEDDKFGFRVLARLAKNKFVDENVKELAETVSIMRAVDNVTVILLIEGCLGAELTAEELGGVSRRTTESLGDIRHVGDDSFNAIALAFNFGGQKGHTVTIEFILDIAADVHNS
jgi:hypothetical protein